MDFSNLLNPSPETETRPTPDTLPPIQRVPSNEDTRTISPVSSRSNNQNYTYSSATQQEAAQALASLSQSPQPPPAQWNGYTAPDANAVERQRSWERRQSGFGDPIQLPPPPMGSDARKMSSPTLEQYHVASRSPEQRRQSIVSPPQANFILPPLQGFEQPQAETARRQSQVASHEVNVQQRSPPSSSHGNHSNAPSALHQSEPQMEPLTQTPSTTTVADTTSPQQSKPQTTTTPSIAEEVSSSPAIIKQENTSTPQPSSPIDARRPSDVDQKALKTVTSLKSEHSMSKQSPLRESSVPIPSTEDPTLEQASTNSKKRPAPAKTKKGTASMVKKDKAAPPAKKRKVEIKKSGTPSTAKGTSAKGTPMNSSPAPSNRSQSGDPDEVYEDEDEDMEGRSDDGDEYCICRKPDNGTFMIGCDGPCEDWFHGKCVGIAERDKNLIDKYICPNCTKTGKHGLTTWKRMCRRSGCRNAARIGKSKSGNGSKYCSDECGVAYFRDMVAQSRGSEETAKNRASRRKGSVAGSDHRPGDDDLGARGGALAAGEVKALLNSSKTADEFRKLGDGVLSPPATPDGKDDKSSQYTESETQALHRIETEKEEARHRHGLLKDRMKFVTLAKQAASRTATEKELKPKDYCGYDPRLEWTNEQFQTWRKTKSAEQAFELDTLNVEKKSKEENGVDEDDEASLEICDRKKCARHHEWSKLSVDSLRSEMNDNGDAMRKLEQEESDIKERAALRAKAGKINGEGTVEVHGLGIAAETPPHAIEVETQAQANGAPEVGEPMVVDAAPAAA